MVAFAASTVAVPPPAPADASGRGGVTIPGCVVEAEDVVGWWEGESNLTATVGPDAVGTVGFGPGLIGGAIAFDGTNTVTVADLPTVTEAVTVEAWIRVTPTHHAQGILTRATVGGPDGDDAYSLHFEGEDIVWLTDEWTLRRPEVLRASAFELVDGEFHHVAGTWSPTEIALYVDGLPVASRRSPGGFLNPAASTPLHIGSAPFPGTSMPLTGSIDEPSIYRRALTAAEVDELVAAGPNAKCFDD